jgi:hypothetical protein
MNKSEMTTEEYEKYEEECRNLTNKILDICHNEREVVMLSSLVSCLMNLAIIDMDLSAEEVLMNVAEAIALTMIVKRRTENNVNKHSLN